MNHEDLQGLQVSDTPERSEAEQQAFHDAVMRATIEAEARVGIVEHDLLVAGVRIRVCFAGDRLATEFMPALAHLQSTEDRCEPDAVFHVWDSRSTGVDMVQPPCPRSCFSERGDIWGFNSRRIRSAFHWSEYSVCLFSTIDRTGIFWVDNCDNLAYWTRSSPLRTLFHWVMELHGRQLVHGAVVGTAKGGTLIMGKGGVGKSTTSLACLDAGMWFAGDDYVIIGLEPEPTAWSLYCTAKVAPAQLAAFPALQDLATPCKPGDEKTVLVLYPGRDRHLAHSMPLRWLLTPGFGNQPTTCFEPISPVTLHHAAAFTTMSQLPHAGAHTHAFMGRLVHALPGARLRLGTDVHSTPDALRSLLDQALVASVDPPTETPLVSVVIPVFNGAHFLADAIASVIEQAYPALDIIVVDDGSGDGIEAAVAALPVEVRFVRQFNAGPAAARNRGIRMATGELVAFLDVDDLWTPGNLRTMVEQMLAEPTFDVLIGRAQLARIVDGEPGRGLDYIGNPDESFPYYIGAALYRRNVFADIGGFDERLRFGEDVDWFKRLNESGPRLKRLPQTSLIVRRHDGNMTQGKSATELNMLRTFKLALDRRRARPADA